MNSTTRKIGSVAVCGIMILLVSGEMLLGQSQKSRRTGGLKTIQLPEPNLTGTVSVEEAISRQQKVPGFTDKPLSYAQIGQLAWAGQTLSNDVNERGGEPLEMYILTAEGLFVYRPGAHTLEQVSTADLRKQLSTTVNRPAIAQAGCDIIIAAAAKKTLPKDGRKAMKIMPFEAGQAAGNIRLQAPVMGLGTIIVNEFETRSVERVCRLPGDNEPLVIISAGFPAEQIPQASSSGKPAGGERKALLIVPAVNFRDEEFFETQRILTEAGIKVIFTSSNIGILHGMSGGIFYSELPLDRVRVEDFDAVVFIGGTGASEYFNNSLALEIAKKAAAGNKIVAAISTAPAILANAGVLKDVRATSFLSERGLMLKGGAKYTGTSLERDGLFITSSDSSATTSFARAIAAAIADTNRN